MRNENKITIGQVVSVFVAAVLVFSVVKILGISNVWDINEWRVALSGAGKSLENTITDPPKFPTGSSSNDSGTTSTDTGGNADANTDSASPEASSAAAEGTNSTNVETLLSSLVVGEDQNVNYNRDEWRHWDGYGSSCWSIREEVLYRQSVEGTVVLENSDRNTTTDKSQACYIASGKWTDPYTNETFTNPSDLDVDHMIPLGYAAQHGGQGWASDVKAEYANSLNANHLIAVSASANRQKGARGPSDWKPQESFQCDYAKIWIDISTTWSLTTAQNDYNALEDMLNKC